MYCYSIMANGEVYVLLRIKYLNFRLSTKLYKKAENFGLIACLAIAYIASVSCCYLIFPFLIVTLISLYPLSVFKNSKWS